MIWGFGDMPTALYHLKLELYPQPESTTYIPDHTNDTFVPPAAADIFTSTFPIHKKTAWTKDFGLRATRPALTPNSPRTPDARPASAGQIERPGDALLLPERNPALKEKSPHVPTSPRPSSEHASKDWRFGPVTIDTIDMEVQTQEGKTADGSKGQTGSQQTRAIFVPGDIKTTDVGWGVVHLYKDLQDVPDTSSSNSSLSTEELARFDIDKCSTLCILAVPSWMMPSDLLGFVGDQTREDVSHFRLIRTGRANKYMVLMKFRSPRKARDWQRAWNGRLFSAMEPENCHVVFISTVTFLTSSPSFPATTSDPFTPKPAPPPTPSLIELPTCPVCLERMDSTTGLLTILCQHVFHCACLAKWRGSGCPVCRFSQRPSSTFPFPRPLPPTAAATTTGADLDDQSPRCATCAATTNLWICLICGAVGCGRYDDAHAYAHWEKSGHCYAMDLATQHVWDYAGDGYVHRLIQNKDPGSGAGPQQQPQQQQQQQQQPRHPNAAFRVVGGDSVPREKFEAMAEEYTVLLTGQLESQRRYFEEQVRRAGEKAVAAGERAAEATRAAEALRAEVRAKDELKAEVEGLTKEVDRLRTRGEKFEKLAREGMAQAREEKMLNEGLVGKIKALEAERGSWTEREAGLRAELDELRELNRDLTVFVEGRETLRRMEEEEEGGLEKGEVEAGQVVVGDLGGKRAKKGKGRKK